MNLTRYRLFQHDTEHIIGGVDWPGNKNQKTQEKR
jgi:hypothetical protein